MRRTLAAATVALSLALAATPAVVSAADDGRAQPTKTDPSRSAAGSAHERATQALDRAKALFSRTPAAQRSQSAAHEDATLVLRDLFRSLGDLTPAQRREARAILARPTQGPSHDQNAYTVKRCQGNVCIHWVKRSQDRVPSTTWALKMLVLMNKVWKKEVGGLGYRRPLSDAGRGGNNKFDVYLAQLGDKGIYGYCAPERTKPGFRYIANGFCVLDNDFAEFAPTPPMDAARATAAHEFFHAIQFGYDFAEDIWMMESTATWMEERVFDDVNDNRQYLPEGQLHDPAYPLDRFDQTNSAYGNWVFFEFLSTSFGKGIVKSIWNKAGAFAGAPDMYSSQAISNVLKSRGGFVKAYSRFVGANVLPATFYPEGASWPSVLIEEVVNLTSANRTTGVRGIDELLHMSSGTWRINSSPSLAGSQFRLRIAVNGPAKFRMPGAHVLVAKHDGTVKRYLVRLNDNGNGTLAVGFDYTNVASVYVSLVNASNRFKCGLSSQYSCNGLPIDDGATVHGQPYKFTASVIESS